MSPAQSAAVGFFARPLRARDLCECLELQPERMGDELVGRARAMEIWRALMRSPAWTDAVIEAPLPVNGRKIVGFGADLAVSRAFAEEELADPKPGTNARLLASFDAGKSVVLSRQEIATGNAAGGLDFLVVYGSVLEGLSLDQAFELAGVMSHAYMRNRGGYRVHRVFTEAVAADDAYFEATHIMPVVKRFEGQNGSRRCLRATLLQQQRDGMPNMFAAPLFNYSNPVLRLRESEQELLLAAAGGLTDEDLADELGLSLTAVKKRWASVYERTLQARPDLFPQEGGQEPDRRGRQKRHHVLAYVHAHPEELRPYAWPAEGKRAGKSRGRRASSPPWTPQRERRHAC